MNAYLRTTLFLALAAFTGCSAQENGSDAYGNFEAIETLVSPEIGGRLVDFSPQEGDVLGVGQSVGLVDTVQLSLRRAQLQAQRRAIRSRFPGIAAQVDVLEVQIRVAEREQKRVQDLLADGAATAKQMDDVNGQLDVLYSQVASVRSQNGPLFAETDVLAAQVASLEDQIARAEIINPVSGTVLVTYARESEMAAPGKPVYRIAALDTLELRAYVSGDQLGAVRLGQAVSVLVDAPGGGTQSIEGRISWIASEAEFTPKLIQTREERVNLVYAFKVRVANPDGALKIGMPGEVVFGAEVS